MHLKSKSMEIKKTISRYYRRNVAFPTKNIIWLFTFFALSYLLLTLITYGTERNIVKLNIYKHRKYPTIKDLHIILPFTIYYLIEIMCSVLQNVNFATTTTNTERFVCNRQKIALNSVANLYVNSLPNNKQSIRWGER